MSNGEFDTKDREIKRALSSLVDQMPAAGMAEGWERIERTLYPRARGWVRGSPWRTVLVSVVLVFALVFGLSRTPAVNAWGWKLLYASRDFRQITWQADAGLDSILGIPFRALIVDPGSSEWNLQAISLDVGEDAGTVVALRYKDEAGAVFTLREEPAADSSETPDYDSQNPNRFLLKVGRTNIAVFLPGPGLVSASWVTDGLDVEIWGNGGAQALLRLIESLVPYPPQPAKSSTS